MTLRPFSPKRSLLSVTYAFEVSCKEADLARLLMAKFAHRPIPKAGGHFRDDALECFPMKWMPVRWKSRQNKELEV